MSNLLIYWKTKRTFTFFAGSLLVLCGPSGVGKSTLVKRLLSSLVEKLLQSARHTFKGLCACVTFVGNIFFANVRLQTRQCLTGSVVCVGAGEGHAHKRPR